MNTTNLFQEFLESIESVYKNATPLADCSPRDCQLSFRDTGHPFIKWWKNINLHYLFSSTWYIDDGGYYSCDCIEAGFAPLLLGIEY